MLVKKSSLICSVAIYATIALTLPYEWRVGAIDALLSTSVASIIVIILYFFCEIHSKMMMMFVLYNVALLFSSYINAIPLEEQLNLSLMGIALAAAFELLNKYANKMQFGIYVFYFVALVWVNSLQTIYYGSSRDVSGYLCIFGNKNWYLYKILPALYLLIFWSVKYGKSILNFELCMTWILAMVSVIVAASSAGTLVLGFWLLYIICVPVIKRIKQNKIFDNYILYIVAAVFVFFSIVIWNVAEIFAPIIVDLLGKDLTFTTRTRIWVRAIELIKEKPLLGYGALAGESVSNMFYGVPDFTTVHNQYLGELFRGGIVLLTIFIIILVMAFRKLAKYKEINGGKIMTFGLFCLLLWWMMESITSMYLILVLFICYHMPNNLENQKM